MRSRSASKITATLRVGIAGWSNPPSHKAHRSSAQSHLRYYAEHFSCVEINSSFYREHRKSTYKAWREATPPSFEFAVKMPRSVTHECALRHADKEIAGFFEGIAALQPKLRVVLVQLPPSLEFSAALTLGFFRSVPRLHGMRLVCEPRHGSWFTGTADALLARLRVSRVAADPSAIEGADKPGGSRDFAYFRWHGSPRKYYSSYSRAQLNQFAAGVTAAHAADSWCIFDNTAAYAAWDNALAFKTPVVSPTPRRRSAPARAQHGPTFPRRTGGR